jgi:hypothetical protein
VLFSTPACICLHARCCGFSKKVLLKQTEFLDVVHNMRQDVFTGGAARCWDSYTKDQRHHTIYSLHDPCGLIGKGRGVGEGIRYFSSLYHKNEYHLYLLFWCASFESFNINCEISISNPAEGRATTVCFRGT